MKFMHVSVKKESNTVQLNEPKTQKIISKPIIILLYHSKSWHVYIRELITYIRENCLLKHVIEGNIWEG